MNAKTIIKTLGSDEILAIGIDVSKARLTIGVINPRREQVFSLSNEHASVTALAQALCAGDYGGKLVLESTGYYHWCAAVGLSQAGLDVRLVNPLMASISTNGRNPARRSTYHLLL